MRPIRFVHCADLHIDSPLKRISAVDTSLGEILRQSTYRSFERIIDLAIGEEVDCVLISGDIYQSADKSLHAQLRFRDGLGRLSEKGIPTYIVHGNHDPLDSWSHKLEWPDTVFVFPSDKAACWPLQRNGETIAEICGISYETSDVRENLVSRFPNERGDLPRIGLLHTNVGSNPDHGPYAPASVEDLSATGMDYWALGHVHSHTVLRPSNPAIVYPGCSQSTHPGEVGEKGCCVVTLETGLQPEIAFVATDTVRYRTDLRDISECVTIDDVISSINSACEAASIEMNGRNMVLRLALTGRTGLDADLRRGTAIGDIETQVREYWEDETPRIWLDKLTLGTAGTYDLDLLRRGNAFISDVVAIYDDLENPLSEHWGGIRQRLKSLYTNRQCPKWLDELPESELLELAREARSLTLDMLVKSD